MRTEIYWIPGPTPGRLAIMARPRGGDWLEEEVRSWRSAGIDIVLSLLTPNEVTDLDLAREEAVCNVQGIEVLTFPIPDRSVPPSMPSVLGLVTKLAKRLAQGQNIAIHCRQGIGRSALIAICLVVHAGLDPEAALTTVSAVRGCRVPETVEQERWIAQFVNESMGSVLK